MDLPLFLAANVAGTSVRQLEKSMSHIPVLKILADGELHSGQDLAQTLGVSRTAIWKQLAQLEELGLGVQRLRGQGYCLSRPLDLLDVERTRQYIDPLSQAAIEVHLVGTVPSTNDYLSGREVEGLSFSACLAEQQTAGRGRRGRVWQSPFGLNLYLSLAFVSARGVSGLDGLSLVIGIAVVKSLQGLGVEGLQIKWPNDIWLQGRKLGGILVELSGELQTRCRVIVGVGLNVEMVAEEGALIDQPWISLAEAGLIPEGGRNQLAGQLLQDLTSAITLFEREGFAAFRHEWDSLDALKGRQLVVLGQETNGLGVGIDDRGAYCLRTAEGKVYLNAGEVSIRPEQRNDLPV